MRTMNDKIEDLIHNSAWAQHALLFIVIAGTSASQANLVLPATRSLRLSCYCCK